MRTWAGSSLPHAGRAGFTLIEILAVILILGVLSTLLVINLMDAAESTNVSMTRADLARLEGVIDSYELEFGDYPPSSFSEGQGIANDGLNTGIEALVAALWSNHWEAGGAYDAEILVNLDGDQAAHAASDLGKRLYEIPDRWGNPIAYFHRRDYGRTNRAYMTLDPNTGEELESVPQAAKDPETGRHLRHNRYQLLSAGPDGEFGTEDDVTTYKRP